MTVNEAVTLIQVSLDDTSGNRYTTAIILPVLDSVQSEIASVVCPELLRSLHASDTDTSGATGDTLPTDYLKMVAVKLSQISPEKWIKETSVDRLNKQNISMLGGKDSQPEYYIWADRFFVLLDDSTYDTTESTHTLYYIKELTTLAVGGSFEIHNLLHLPMVEMALSKLQITYKHGDLSLAFESYKANYQKVIEYSTLVKEGKIDV